MRFILFNLVVGAAVVYLISGNAGDTLRSAGFSKPLRRSTKISAIKLARRSPKWSQRRHGATPAEENPKPKAVAKTHETSATAMKTPELKKTVPPLEEAKTVVSRPIHKTPPSKANPVDEAPKGQLASVSPEVDKRRAEILGKKDDGPKYAIEGGEQLMSATDRYRELSKLVDDMELVYFNSLGK